MIGVAQNAYQTLQANNIFQNKDFLATDEFVTATGTNGTKIGGTATFSVDKYELSSSNLGTSLGQLVSGYNNAGVANITTNAILVKKMGYFNKVVIGAGGYNVAFNVTFNIQSLDNLDTILNVTKSVYNGTADSISFQLNSSDYNRMINANENISFSISSSVNTFDAINKVYSDAYFSYSLVQIPAAVVNINPYQFQEIIYSTNSTLTCNSATLDGTENSLPLYIDKSTPTGTDITVDASDGTTSITNQQVNSTIDISSLGSGTLSLTFNLSTTDVTVEILENNFNCLDKK